MNEKWVVVNTRTEQVASGHDSELYDSKLEARSDARDWNRAIRKENQYRVYRLVEDS